jgi:hypothetical protein
MEIRVITYFSPSAAGVSAALVPTLTPAPVCTPAGVLLKRLSQAAGLRRVDRLLVSGFLHADALCALTATGVSAVALVRPDRPYPNPERADVVWVLGVDRDDAIEPRLGMALRCLAPAARLLIELCTIESSRQASAIVALLRRRGIETVRVEPLRSGVVLVRGHAPTQRRRAA